MSADKEELDSSIELDAARYRWLKSRAIQEGRDGGYVQLYSFPLVMKDDFSKKISHHSLDEAIDAQIAGK
ncbi:hypothetical protein ABLV11_00240 [Klebsiella sp. GW_Kp181]|uniref:hypothetical protein n=1 Tax=Klebsiella sp. GW_Kp181 TaxID=3153492 RepID=UPI0032B56EE5